MKTLTKKEQGFTLIELMIVVAIIGILAAVAIPQFASYRVKAFNSAAQSDLRTLKLSEEGYYSDYQNYGATGATGSAALGAGTAVTGGTPGDLGDGTNAAVTVSPSAKVSVNAATDATGSSMTVESGHEQGNKVFAMDSDMTATYTAVKTAGSAFTATAFGPKLGSDEVNGVAAGSAGGGTYAM